MKHSKLDLPLNLPSFHLLLNEKANLKYHDLVKFGLPRIRSRILINLSKINSVPRIVNFKPAQTNLKLRRGTRPVLNFGNAY